MTRMGAAVAALLVVAVSGCATANPGGSDGGSLEKRTFLSTSSKPRSLLPGTRIWLSFPEKGQIAAQAGCNHLFGKLAFDADKLVVTEMGGTDMGCEQPRMEQDQWLTTFLTSRPTWKLNGDELTLTSGETQLKLLDRLVADPDRQLVGPKWTVESLLDGEGASSVPSGVIAVLSFSADGKVSGTTGCNLLNGDARVNGDKLTFGALMTTKRLCTEPAGPVEGHVLGVLDGEVTWRIEADKLILTHPSGRGLQLRAAG
jgi:heat shock protein HslJ